MNSNMPKEIK